MFENTVRNFYYFFNAAGSLLIVTGLYMIFFSATWLPYGKYDWTGWSAIVNGFLILLPFLYYWRRGGESRGYTKESLVFFQAVVLFFILLSALGELILYRAFPNYDTFLHTVMPFSIYFLLFVLYYVNFRYEKKEVTPHLYTRIFIYTIGLVLAWELFEYIGDNTIGFPEFLTNGDPVDLYVDIMADVVGISAAFFVAHKWGARFSEWLMSQVKGQPKQT